MSEDSVRVEMNNKCMPSPCFVRIPFSCSDLRFSPFHWEGCVCGSHLQLVAQAALTFMATVMLTSSQA